MAEHKGTITLIIARLVVFSLFVIFNTEVVGPLLNNIGTKFTSMVNDVFTGTTSTNMGGNLPSNP